MSLSSVSRAHGLGKSSKHERQRSLFMHIVSSIGYAYFFPLPHATHFYFFHNKHYRSIITLTTSRHLSDGPRSASAPTPSASNSPPPPPHPSPTSLPPPGPSVGARALRRATHSTLVDKYRRFVRVLPKLVRRFNRTIRVVGNEIEISNDKSHAFGHQPRANASSDSR